MLISTKVISIIFYRIISKIGMISNDRTAIYKLASKITKVEVWVTNKTGTTDNTRNILAFLDLGESEWDMNNTTLFSDNNLGNLYPDNDNNTLYQQMVSRERL